VNIQHILKLQHIVCCLNRLKLISRGICVCVCVCVCERERERKKERKERERESENMQAM
jgi:hypothetical protein